MALSTMYTADIEDPRDSYKYWNGFHSKKTTFIPGAYKNKAKDCASQAFKINRLNLIGYIPGLALYSTVKRFYAAYQTNKNPRIGESGKVLKRLMIGRGVLEGFGLGWVMAPQDYRITRRRFKELRQNQASPAYISVPCSPTFRSMTLN